MTGYLYIVYLAISFLAAFGMTVFAVTFGYILREAKVGEKEFDLSKTGLQPIHINIIRLFYVICFVVMILAAAFAGFSV